MPRRPWSSRRVDALGKVSHNLAFFELSTQLPNRCLFLDRLGQALTSRKRSARYFAPIVLDLDHFKSLNDTQGHDMGDSLLVEVARRLLESVRGQDTVSRRGGDEFVVILENLDTSEKAAAAHVEEVAEKIRLNLGRPYSLGDADLEQLITTSIGVTLFRGQENSPDVLLKQADVALYQAKDAGRNIVRYFIP